jgi:polyisoprenoid-binding protein YceI
MAMISLPRFASLLHLRRSGRATGVGAMLCSTILLASHLLAAQAHAQILSPTPSVPQGMTEYQIDPEHSSVQFAVRHLGISMVRGEFQTFQGSFTYPAPETSPENFSTLLAQARASVTIEVNSISTRAAKRDKHLKSADFLFASKFPEIKFTTNAAEVIGPEAFRIRGTLSLRGVAQDVQLEVEGGKRAKDPWGNERVGFFGRTSINRFAYGVKWDQLLETGAPVVAPDVEIELHIEGIKAGSSPIGTAETTPTAPN